MMAAQVIRNYLSESQRRFNRKTEGISMALEYTFNPAYGRGITVSPVSSSARSEIGKGSKSIVVSNLGTDECYVRTGDSSVTATSADYVVLPSQQVSLTKFQDDTHIAYLSTSGTTLHIIPGEGI